VLFFFLWLYFDHVDASNRGIAYSPLFFLDRNFWINMMPPKYHTLKANSKKRVRKYDLGELKNQDEVLNSADKEKKKVIKFEEEGVFADGLRVVNVHKTYMRSSFGIKSKNDVHAVRGVYLEVPKDEMLCLLGHNGAGKSTLFNMMTGMIATSSGEGKICGFDIREN